MTKQRKQLTCPNCGNKIFWFDMVTKIKCKCGAEWQDGKWLKN